MGSWTTLLPVVAALLGAVSAAANTFDGRAGQIRLAPPRLDATVTIDGALDEAVWAQAAVLTGFSQYAPADGREAAQRTEILVWYSATAMYFGIRAEAPPGTVRATLADRDRIDTDDRIEILLSTFNDGRQALVFGVNPLGVQFDGTLVEGAQRQGGGFGGLTAGREDTDTTPDFVFQSRGRVTASGFDVEVRIPFRSLRYSADDSQTWGLHIVRRVQATGHEDSWVAAKRDAASFLAQAGAIEGLHGLSRGLVLDLNPVITAKSDGSRGGETWHYDTSTPEPGLNVRWGVTPNLTLNGTINPDFSQVEADAGQFVFDPRSAVFFPEKRPFFLDSAEFFTTPNNLIYTRRITAPLGAAKLTGKLGGTSLGMLSAVDDDTVGVLGDHPVFTIARVQHDLGAQSRVAVVYTDRTEDAGSNRVLASDARVVFRELYSIQGQAAVSRTAVAGAARVAPLWEFIGARTGKRFSFQYELRGVDEAFRAGSGFISRAGIAEGRLTHQVGFDGAKGAVLERWTSDVVLDGTWQYDDFVNGRGMQDRKLHFNNNARLRGGWEVGGSVLVETFGFDPRFYADYRLLAPDGALLPFTGTPVLGNLDYVLQLTAPPRKGVSGSAFVLWGRDENFFEWSSADIAFVRLSALWRPTEQLRADAGWQLQSYQRRSDGTIVGRRAIPRLKVEYQLSRAIFLRGVAEYDTERQDDLRDDSRTELPIATFDLRTGGFERALGYERARLRGEWLFSYQPSPGTVLFVGYTGLLEDPVDKGVGRLRRQTDGFFVKLSYLFRL